MSDQNSYLTKPNFGSADIVKGRNVRDGYARGWGLRFDGLIQKVMADPLYQEASVLAQSRSVVAEHNRANIFLLLKFYLHKIPWGEHR